MRVPKDLFSRRWICSLVLLGALAGCGIGASAVPAGSASLPPLAVTPLPTTPSAAVTATDLIAPHDALVAAGAPSWEYRREAAADFDGDGVEERAVVIANVGLYNGRPLWEDGHRWQVYVEEADGTRTHVYARFVPNGHVEALLVAPAAAGTDPNIILIERMPDRIALYEVHYRAPNDVHVVELVRRSTDPARGFSGTPD